MRTIKVKYEYFTIPTFKVKIIQSFFKVNQYSRAKYVAEASHVHPEPINLVFYKLTKYLFQREVSGLDAFSLYPRQRSCSTCPYGQQIHQRLRPTVPFVLNASFSQILTHQADIIPTASQRCKPSSRTLLMGEHPHLWQLLHYQVRMSRHRCSKPLRRYELSGATTLLSPW